MIPDDCRYAESLFIICSTSHNKREKMKFKLIVFLLLLFVPLYSCASKSNQNTETKKIVSVWKGTFNSDYHTDGDIPKWVLFDDGTMTGKWITQKGSAVINVEGKYKIEDNKISFDAFGTLILYNKNTTNVQISGNGILYAYEATGTFTILIENPRFPDDKGTWELSIDFQKVVSSAERIRIEGVSILPPEGDDWYLKKEHDGSIRFRKSGKTQDQSIVGEVVLFKLPDLKSKEEFLNLVSEQRAKDSQGPREILLNKEVLSDEKGEFCVRTHTVSKEFKAKNLPVTSDFLLMENIELNCRHPYDKNIAVHIGFSQRTLPNNTFKDFESDANKFIKNVILTPFQTINVAKGYSYFQAKEYQRAIEHFNLAIAEDPADYKAYFFRAHCYLKQERLSLAISDWEKTISLKKDYVEAYANLARAYQWMKEYQKALSYADTAINTANSLSLEEQIQYELPGIYQMRGQIHYGLKNQAQAILDFTKAIDMDPKLISAYMMRGLVYDEQGNYSKADQDFKIGELDNDDAFVLNTIAWFYATCKDKQYRNGFQAVRFSSKAVEIDPSAAHLDTMGAAYVENQQYEKAIETYKRVIEKDGTVVERYQKSLNEKGCYSGPIDGVYSMEFEKALRRCILQGHYL